MKEKTPFDFERFKQEAMEGLYAGKKAGGTDGVFAPLMKHLLHLHLLTDMKYVYETGGTLKKQELVKMVFDSNLYYKNNIYRTPTMIDVLSHNHQKMKGLNLLILEKKEGLQNEIPHSGE